LLPIAIVEFAHEERRMLTRHRLRTIEATAFVTAARLALLVLPFAWIAAATGNFEAAHPGDRPRRATVDPVSRGVREALRAAVRRLPGRTTCLTRAIAGRMMLAWRGTPSTVVLGVASDGDKLSAHAWLVTADGCVCGGREAERFRPLAAIRS
jgi:hypothetical protein